MISLCEWCWRFCLLLSLRSLQLFLSMRTFSSLDKYWSKWKPLQCMLNMFPNMQYRTHTRTHTKQTVQQIECISFIQIISGTLIYVVRRLSYVPLFLILFFETRSLNVYWKLNNMRCNIFFFSLTLLIYIHLLLVLRFFQINASRLSYVWL